MGKQLYSLISADSLSNCDIISGQNKTFKPKYLINKAQQHKNIKEHPLQFKKFFHIME